MISLRCRRYGSSEWTVLSLEGDLEEAIAGVLQVALDERNALATADQLHLQAAREGEPWVDLEDFEWEEG